MFFPFVLEGPVGRSSPPDGGDIFDVKTVLNDLGLFEPPTGEITPFTETALFDGISDFQSNNSIPVTGTLRSGDRTVRTLRDQFARAHGRRQNGVARIGNSVGSSGINAAADSGRVGDLLRRSGHFTSSHQTSASPDLVTPIRAFQARVGLAEDGVIKPNGETLEILSDVTELARPTLAQASPPPRSPAASQSRQLSTASTFPIRPGMVITDVPRAYRAFGFDPNIPGDKFNAIEKRLGLAMWLVRNEAEKMTMRCFGRDGHNDDSDAFRHAYASYLFSERVGVDIAKELMDGHEADALRRTGGPVDHGEILMDLFNNRMGREIFRTQGQSGRSPKDLIMTTLRSRNLQTRPFQIR